jgi:hypothetical protein
MQSGASLARAIGPTLGGVLMNNAFNRVDDATLYPHILDRFGHHDGRVDRVVNVY